MTIAGQSIRAVALGIIVTAVVQAALVGLGLAVTGVPYALALTTLAFMLCLAQLGPLLVLLPAIVWLYWQDANVAGTALLVWSLIVGSLDNILRPILIRRGAESFTLERRLELRHRWFGPDLLPALAELSLAEHRAHRRRLRFACPPEGSGGAAGP